MRSETVARMKSEFAACLKARGAVKGFRAEKKTTVCELYIYDVIGSDYWTGEGVTAKAVAETLDANKDAKSLSVYINSPGGIITEAKAIYSLLGRFQGQKTMYVDGVAASAASFVAMAGDKIVTGSAATWMIHEAMGGAYGYAEDLTAVADVLRMLTNDAAAVYEKRTGQPRQQIAEWMKAETWMDAATALERGFTDEVAADPAEPDEDDPKAEALPMFTAIAATQVQIADLSRSRFLDNLKQCRPAASRGAVPGQPGRTPAK
jgi:ATP-dependent Clp protease, protease subunit